MVALHRDCLVVGVEWLFEVINFNLFAELSPTSGTEALSTFPSNTEGWYHETARDGYKHI